MNSFTLALQHRPAEKAPAIDGRDKLSRAGRNVEFSPSALQHLWGDCRAEHPLVAFPNVRGLVHLRQMVLTAAIILVTAPGTVTWALSLM